MPTPKPRRRAGSHFSITAERVHELAESNMFGLTSYGICLACGNDQSGCEPDAEGYLCESCGEREVMGAEEIIVRGLYH